VTVYRRPDPIPLPHARPVHGRPRAMPPAPAAAGGAPRPPAPGLSAAVARDLAVALMRGRFQRDGVLWTESQLCGAFGVSRTALREAIKILSAKGIVEPRRKRGTILLPRGDWILLDPDVMLWLLTTEPEPTRRLLEEALSAVRAAGRTAPARDNPFLAALMRTAADALAAAEAGGTAEAAVAPAAPVAPVAPALPEAASHALAERGRSG
jgi:DNA-binding FadR family transcriptional regulator